ncbi:MAG: hypothetical protein R3B40_22620 [Polyangiales bacterium]
MKRLVALPVVLPAGRRVTLPAAPRVALSATLSGALSWVRTPPLMHDVRFASISRAWSWLDRDAIVAHAGCAPDAWLASVGWRALTVRVLPAALCMCVATGCATAPGSEGPRVASQTADDAASTDAPGRATEEPPLAAVVRSAVVYPVDAAVGDALAEPLQFVGFAAWPGLFHVLSCVYQNDRVVVVDERCIPIAPGRATIHIYSPTAGHVALWGRSADGAPLLSMEPRRYESFGVATYFVPPAEAQPAVTLGMGAEAMQAHQDAMTALGAERHRRGEPQEPSCWYSTDRGLVCDRMDETVFSASARPFIDEPAPAWRQLLEQMLRARAVPRPLDASSPARLSLIGAVYARVHGCDVLEQLDTIGNRDGVFAPILWLGGDELLMVCAAQRGRAAAQVVRVEGLRVTARHVFPSPPRNACQAQSLVALPDGDFVVYSLCGTRADEARGHEHPRLTRFSRDFTVRWTWVGGPGEHASHSIQRRADGSFRILGHINPLDRSDAVGWQATVSATGQLLERAVGGSYTYDAE